jgi:hypothetical protein
MLTIETRIFGTTLVSLILFKRLRKLTILSGLWFPAVSPLVSKICIFIFQNGHYIFLTLQIPCQNKYHVASGFANFVAS